jgi:hypothetical protein
MAAGRAWVLNLDADLELGRAARMSGTYTPTRAVREAMAPHVEQLARTLLAPGDLVVDEASEPGVAAGREGHAFCPTSRAVALLVRAGAAPCAHPPSEVLALVNSRAFSAALGQTLPDGAYVRSVDDALAVLRRAPSIAPAWRAKRAFGMAGRGHRTIEPSAITGADEAFLRAAMAEGGLQIEPNVRIVRELALHGVLGRDGSFASGRLVIQTCDERGQWLASVLAREAEGEVEARTREALSEELARAALALHRAGYFGPFGLDAFEYRGAGGVVLQPRSEINARYSMGYPVGFGGEATSSSSRVSARSSES